MSRFSLYFCSLIITLTLATSQALHGQALQPDPVFTSQMVLQQNHPITVWGQAKRKQKISVKFASFEGHTQADRHGNWQLTLGLLLAGGPYQMTISSPTDTVIFADILVGDVWLCAGQSNMEYAIKNFEYAKYEAAKANNDQIRLFALSHEKSALPQNTTPYDFGWRLAMGNNILDFSAVGYFFGKQLQPNVGVPLGLISSNWGGTPAENWLSPKALSQTKNYAHLPLERQQTKPKQLKKQQRKYNNKIEKWNHKIYKKEPLGQVLPYQIKLESASWTNCQLPGRFSKLDSTLQNYEGSVWFARSFDLPNQYTQKTLKLKLGQIDEWDQTYVNHQPVGHTLDWSACRNYTLKPNTLQTTNNQIKIRVTNLGGWGGFIKGNFGIYDAETDTLVVGLKGRWKFKTDYKLTAEAKNQLPDFPTKPKALKVAEKDPGTMYNAMINPLTRLGIKGVIWYQGEANGNTIARALEYRKVFPLLIDDWRKNFNNDSLPFLFVQLASYQKTPTNPCPNCWPILRESQAMALGLPNTGMTIATDLGLKHNIHPPFKQAIGERLSLLAQKIGYNQNLPVYASPMFDRYEKQQNAFTIFFKNTGQALSTTDKYGYIRGFEIAGPDRVFLPAKATIVGKDKVKVWHPKVDKPAAVRYNWKNYAPHNELQNNLKLPAAPFRTDSWPFNE